MSSWLHLRLMLCLLKSKKKQYPDKKPLELQKLSDTQWSCQYASINAICCRYNCLLLTLKEILTSLDHKREVEAKVLLNQIQSFSFIISLVMFHCILSCTKQLSDQLQSSTVDLYRASELVSRTKSMLQHFCTDEYWNQVYKYATVIAKLHSIPEGLHDDLRPSQKRRRPAHLENSVITESVGSREPTTTKDHFKANLYLAIC